MIDSNYAISLAKFIQASLFSACGLLVACTPQVQMPSNPNNYIELFHNALTSLTINKNGARFVVRQHGAKFILGKLAADNSEFSFDFTLTKPGEAFSSPDKHGSRLFEVKEITEHGITLKYNSKHNASSFGDNHAYVEEGEFLLKPFSRKIN